MGYHALNSLEIWDRMAHLIIQFLINGIMHLHCVCGGSESVLNAHIMTTVIWVFERGVPITIL